MRPADFPRKIFLPAAFLALNVSTAWGLLPQPVVTTIYPPGGRAGSDVDVAVVGTDLDDAQQMLFTHPGIRAQIKPGEPAKADQKLGVTRLQFQVKIDGKVPPGVYEARLVGRFGVTNPRVFVVGSAAEVLDTEGNISDEKASELAFDSIVNGRLQAGECKYYKIALKANERVVVTCQGKVVDSRLWPVLSLLSPAGREIARTRSMEGGDAALAFTAPSDGTYVIRLNDIVYGGGDEHFFRLSAKSPRSEPRIESIFPPAGFPGSNGSYTIYGHNLPNGQPADGAAGDRAALEKAEVNIAIPADGDGKFAVDTRPGLRRAGLASIEYGLASPAGSSNTVPLYIATAPVVVEQEPNAADRPQPVAVPCEIAGRFAGPDDEDWYQFSAKKGDVVSLDVMSHRMGLSTDPFLAVFRVVKDGTGAETLTDLAEADDGADDATGPVADFNISSVDPSHALKIDEDGVYRVMLGNRANVGRSSLDRMYRLSIRTPRPDFSLVAKTERLEPHNPAIVWPVTPMVRKGGTTLIDVKVLRSGGFSGDVTIGVEGLPQGLTAYPVTAGAADKAVPLILSAADSMGSWVGPVKIVGKARIDGTEVTREARYAVMAWGSTNRDMLSPVVRLSQSMHVSVIGNDPEVLVLEVEDKVWETSIGHTLEIPIKIIRRGELKGAIKLSDSGPLPFEKIDAPANADQVKLRMSLSKPGIKPGLHTFFVQADAQRPFVRNPDAVPAAEAKLKDATDEVARLTEAKKAAPADKELDDKLQKATALKAHAEAKVAEAKTASGPTTLTFSIASPPIKVRVAPAPFAIAAPVQVTVKAGQKAEVPITLTRSFGYADGVALVFEPMGVRGLRAATVSVAKDQSAGKIEIVADAKTPPGDHAVSLKATGTFNGVAVEMPVSVTVKVLPAP